MFMSQSNRPAAEGHWVTIHCRPVLIKSGESVGPALRKHFEGSGTPIDHTHIAGAARQIRLQGGRPNVEPADQTAKAMRPQTAATAGPVAADQSAQRYAEFNKRVRESQLIDAEKSLFLKGAGGKGLRSPASRSTTPEQAIREIKSVRPEVRAKLLAFYQGKYGNQRLEARHVVAAIKSNVPYEPEASTRIDPSNNPFDDQPKSMATVRSNAIAAVRSPGRDDEGKPFLSASGELYLSATGGVQYLSAACDVRDAVTLGQGLPKKINGLPMHYRWVDAAYADDWSHPKTGRAVPIDEKRIDGWVSNIKLSRSRGVNLPVCKDHKETADNCVGEIFDARRTGNRLDLLLGFKGDDALKVGQRNYLSIGIDPNFRDSRKNAYGEAIRHVAVTPVPVIHGQVGFLPD